MEKINLPKESQWLEFYENTKNLPPSGLLVEALPLVQNKEHALDLGGGALRDTKKLLADGFTRVTIVDSEPLMKKASLDFPQDRIEAFITTFDKFDFPINQYDFVNAQFSLPFNPKETFESVITRIKSSLRNGGIFSGQLFGINDEWNVPGKNMTFQNTEEAKELFSDMEVIKFEEIDRDGKVANGTPKHWNFFNIIARKK